MSEEDPLESVKVEDKAKVGAAIKVVEGKLGPGWHVTVSNATASVSWSSSDLLNFTRSHAAAHPLKALPYRPPTHPPLNPYSSLH